MTDRLMPDQPFSPMQKLVVTLVARGEPYTIIGKRLHISDKTVKHYAENACKKLPGDLPARMKIVFWWRGATRPQLEESGFELDLSR